MNINRGDIWLVDFNPIIGREQAGIRPALIISVDSFNESMANKVIAVPLTSRDKGIPLDVKIEPTEGGVTKTSFIKSEDIRSISKERLIEKWDSVSEYTLSQVSRRISMLLGI